MTIASTFWRRRYPQLPASQPRLFQVEPGTQLRGECHWQSHPQSCPTLVLVHGLEGSSQSGYMLGTAEKAWIAGFNVVRLNQRNCGGTEALSATLYNSALSGDVRAVIEELISRDGIEQVFAAGFSMGGNLVLKMAGELGETVPPQIGGFVAVAPTFDLAACVDALAAPQNFLYQRHFVRRLKGRMRRKARLFPDRFPIDGSIHKVHSVRDFDELITARFCGFAGADDYYARASARQFLQAIRRPTLIVTAQDDPFVPFETFADVALRENTHITLLAPRHGGHSAFISNDRAERFWVEARIVEFCQVVGKGLAKPAPVLAPASRPR